MFARVRGVGGFPFAAMALALGIWGLAGRPALAQGGGPGAGAGAGHRVVIDGGYGLGYGSFGPGYPGYGLEYVHGCGLGHHHRDHPGELSVRNWCSDVMGRECLYPYVADPYSDPMAAMGFWPPYSAPIASVPSMAARMSDLGIDEEPVVDAAGARGMKVARVHPGTAAAKAGIQPGDVLHSINGYLTQQHGNLAWIIANAAPSHRLEIHLRSVRDGREHTITAQIN